MDKVKIVKFLQLNLYKNYNDEDDNYGLLSWSIRAGYPRITVFTKNNKVKSDAPFDYNTMIVAPFDYLTLNMLFETIESVLKGDKDKSESVFCYNTKFINGNRTNEIVLQATVKVGKDKEGVMYMAVLEEGKKKVKFEILPTKKWHKFSVEDRSILSIRYTKAYLKVLKKLMDDEMKVDMMTVNEMTKPQVPKINKDDDLSDI